MRIRDLVYFDFDKAASIWSQTNDGLTETDTSSTEATKSSEMAGGFNAVISNAKGAHGRSDRETRVQVRRVHHNLLNQIETSLEAGSLVTDTNNQPTPTTTEQLRKSMALRPYVRISGTTVFEDYPRLKRMASEFRTTCAFINRCNINNGTPSEAAQNAMSGLDKLFGELELASDEKEVARVKRKIAATQTQLESNAEGIVGELPAWLLRGILDWIDLFAGNRRIVRLCSPNESAQVEVVGNLKLDSFVDQDLDHVLFAYGQRPSTTLTLFGLVTHMPTESPAIATSAHTTPAESMHAAFENVFTAMNGVYETMNPVQYPRIAVHPIALYRDIASS